MKFNRVVKNASWIIICRLVQAVFALIINGLTARYFGPSSYGVINYAASLVAFVTPLMKLGTNSVLVNEIIKSPQKEGEILGTSMTMTTVSSLMCISGLFVFSKMANYDDPVTVTVVVLYSLILIAQSLEQIQYWFQAKLLSKIVSLTSLAVYLVISAYKLFLLISEKSIYWFAISNALDHLIIAIVLIIVYLYRGNQKLKFSWSCFRELWIKSNPYIIPELMGLVLQQSDRIMLRFMCGNSEVGIYSAALYIAGLSSFVFNAIILSFQPQILEEKIKNEKKYEHNMARLYGIIIYLSLMQIFFMMIFGKYMVNLLYGGEFVESVQMLNVVVWYTMFSYIGSVRTVWILAENKQKYLWIISLSGMVLNIILNVVLIFFFDGTGAAIATLITQVFTNVILIYVIKPMRANIRYMIKGLNIKTIFKYIE